MAWPPPQRRDCQHPGTPHRHGTSTAYRHDGCTCTECRGAVAAAAARTSRAKAYGTHRPVNVDATGTRRRLQALAVVGWSHRALAARCGVVAEHLQTIRSGRTPRITTNTEQVVMVVYDELWDQTPPTTGRHQSGAVTKTRNAATRQGWVGPLDWDDDTINDPTAAPHTGHTGEPVVDEVAIREVLTGRRVPLTRTERAEAVRLATERGWGAERIAERLGCDERTVVRVRGEVAA